MKRVLDIDKEMSKIREENRKKIAKVAATEGFTSPLLIAPDDLSRSNREQRQRIINVFGWLNEHRPDWVGNVLSRDIIHHIAYFAQDNYAGVIDEDNINTNHGKIVRMSLDIDFNNSDHAKEIIILCEELLSLFCTIDYLENYEIGVTYKQFIFRWFIFDDDKADNIKQSFQYICKEMDMLTSWVRYSISEKWQNADVLCGLDIEDIGDFEDHECFQDLDGICNDLFTKYFNTDRYKRFTLWCNIRNEE